MEVVPNLAGVSGSPAAIPATTVPPAPAAPLPARAQHATAELDALEAEYTPVLGVRGEVKRCVGDLCELAEDDLPAEEPLQMRLAGEDVAVTMRTPGHDIELALGFLLSEGIIEGKHHVESVSHCPDENDLPNPNVINVLPTDRTLVDPRRWRRTTTANSSCGICGKTSIEQVAACLPARPDREPATVPLSTLYALEPALRGSQHGFAQTGGLHAAGLFDLGGNLLVLREDIGRHNAVDKTIGYALMRDMLPLDRHILLVSSRASFEIVQKALMAGVSIMAVISAPSSLAVDLARNAGMTLVAFLRGDRLNIYSGHERVVG
jgi:FdhD protein